MFNRARVQGSKLHLLRPTLLLLAATCSGPAPEPGAASGPASGNERPPAVAETATAALRAAYVTAVQAEAGADRRAVDEEPPKDTAEDSETDCLGGKFAKIGAAQRLKLSFPSRDNSADAALSDEQRTWLSVLRA